MPEADTFEAAEASLESEVDNTAQKCKMYLDTIFSLLPKEMVAVADYKLRLYDGNCLDCHSQCLSAVSPVIAVTLATKDQSVCIPLPEYVTVEAAAILLHWLYRLDYKGLMTPDRAHLVALLAHE